jgi:DICT domain-containing protein
MPLVNRQRDARREAHQIVHVGQDRRFVEVVYAPDKAPFAVAPRSEVFDVKVADRRQLR